MEAHNDALQLLIRRLGRLPGLGPRSAQRAVLSLLKDREERAKPLLNSLEAVIRDVHNCSICGNLDTCNPCRICRNEERNSQLICVVAEVDDLWALERGRSFRGRYHVLGGVLSALDGIGPDELRISSLQARIAEDDAITEVIMALPATVEGQTTAHVLRARLLEQRPSLKVTHLARGVPVGGSLDYMDAETLEEALRTRRVYEEE